MDLSGSIAEDNGITTVSGSNLSVGPDRIHGTYAWTWSGVGSACVGSEVVEARRLPSELYLDGVWQLVVTTQQASSKCVDDIGSNNVLTATISQSHCQVFVQFGNSLQGTLYHAGGAERLDLSGSYPDDGGTLTVTGSDLTITGNSAMSGTMEWHWTNGEIECTGVDFVVGSK